MKTRSVQVSRSFRSCPSKLIGPGRSKRLSKESFEPLSVNWPHGSFFDPSFLSCVETSHGSQPHVFIGNSYRQFALTPKNESSATISLSPISLQSLPAGATVLHCALESCTVVKLEEDGTLELQYRNPFVVASFSVIPIYKLGLDLG